MTSLLSNKQNKNIHIWWYKKIRRKIMYVHFTLRKKNKKCVMLPYKNSLVFVWQHNKLNCLHRKYSFRNIPYLKS